MSSPGAFRRVGPEGPPVVGVDIGGTKIAVGVLHEGTVLTRRAVSTPRDGWRAVLECAAALVADVRAEFPACARVGVGVPGRLKPGRREVHVANNIYGFENVPLVEYLGRALNMGVTLENDAKAAALAEATLGAARDTTSSVYVTVSTGIGSGVVIDGRVWRGFHGVAGELGHVVALPGGPVAGSGVVGALEAVASGSAIARDATFALGRPTTTAQTFALAQAGHATAERIVHGALRFLGSALADAQKIVDPEAFVIGGGVAEVGPYFFDLLRDATRASLGGFAVADIRKAALGPDAGVIGAALTALHA